MLGLSEHVFQMSEAHPLLEHLPQEGPLLTFAAYADQVRAAAQSLQFEFDDPGLLRTQANQS